MKPKVSIIVLNWNGGMNTIECLEAIEKINYPNYNILVVDNASTDGSVEMIREKMGSYTGGFRIIQNKENLGFAEGMNVGIRATQSDYVLTLNQDTVMHPDCIQELIEVAESDPNIGIVGPKIYYYKQGNTPCLQPQNDSIDENKENRATEIIYSCGTKYIVGEVSLPIIPFKIKIPYMVPMAIGRGEEDKGQYDTHSSNGLIVEAITGCCMLIKREVIHKIGLFDSRLLLFREDDDYCIRTKKANYKICVAPKSIIWHKINNQKEPKYRTYYRIRNWLLVTRKHFGLKVFAKILFANISKIVRAPLFILVKKANLSSLFAYLWAYLDALTLRTPKRYFRKVFYGDFRAENKGYFR